MTFFVCPACSFGDKLSSALNLIKPFWLIQCVSSIKSKFDLFEAKLVLYLKPAPVGDHDHINILEAGADGDDDPGDEQAVVPQVSPKDEQEGTHNTEERVKHSVLDDGANTNVLEFFKVEVISDFFVMFIKSIKLGF